MADRDTIVAVSSGAGVAGVAVIRISGPFAADILRALGVKDLTPRKAVLARLRHPARGDVLDQALSLHFPGPNSFTGQDVAELHVHGGRAVLNAVLEAILSVGHGIRFAGAGEFTRRAFINGKLDLAEAEGLAALIDSETEWQRWQAMRLLEGELGRMVAGWRSPLIQAMACLDASLDFSDEGDVADGRPIDEIAPLLGPVLADMLKVLASARAGERLRDGFRVAIIGPPNAGKSSLLNAIAGRDVAIVSAEPGTTRDVIEVRCDIEGIPVTFLDTAGIRDADNAIEQEGIRRAELSARGADLVLSLRAVDSEAEHILFGDAPIWTVTTKIDLAGEDQPCGFAVSARDGQGMAELLGAVGRHFMGNEGSEPALVSEARQRVAISEAAVHIASVLKRCEGGSRHPPSEELLAESLRLACLSLDRLIGKVQVEQVLDEIFGRFCIGK
jgi:tRNA modification GTPase